MELTLNTVKELVKQQFPQWQNLDVSPVEKSGHDNRTFHLGNEMTLRLPSGKDYVAQVEKEARWLPVLADKLSLPITRPIEMGEPSESFPYPWSVNTYLQGETASIDNIFDLVSFADELGVFLKELQQIETFGAPISGDHNFYRGSSPKVYHEEVAEALEKLSCKLPVDKLQIIWDKAISSNWDKKLVWIHGDIAPGNLIVKDEHLSGVIDFGIMSVGDPACDYAMAWTFFEGESRSVFLKELDEETINRARGWALWKALITYDDEALFEGANKAIGEILVEFEGENQ